MNNFIELGKEIVNNLSNTWCTLEKLNSSYIKDDILEDIGREIYNNKEIFKDYLFYKYEISDVYKEIGLNEPPSWIAEWWFDERGKDYQKDTFEGVVGIVLNKINWYQREEDGVFEPRYIQIKKERCINMENINKVIGQYGEYGVPFEVAKELECYSFSSELEM